MSLYTDTVKCPSGHRFHLERRDVSAGKMVQTYCPFCRRSHKIKAGALPASKGSK